jgi:hypothetical protein
MKPNPNSNSNSNCRALLAGAGAALIGLSLVSAPSLADSAVRIGTTFEDWDHPTAGVDEWTTLVSASVPLGTSVRADFWGAHVSATSDEDLGVSGLMNTRLRLSYFPGSHWIVRAGVNAPTGKTELTEDELVVSRLLSDRLRGYRGYRLGEGTGVDVSTAWSGPVGQFTLGLGAGYSLKGSYAPSEDDSKLDPGDQLRLTAGADIPGTAWSSGASLSVTHYGRDRVAGRETFQPGARYDLEGHAAYRAARWTASLELERILYAANRVVGETNALVEEDRNSNAPESYVTAQLQFRFTRAFHGLVFGGGRFFDENEYREGKARRFDLGSGLRARVAGRVWTDLRGRWSSARVFQTEGSDLDLNGFQISAGIETRL